MDSYEYGELLFCPYLLSLNFPKILLSANIHKGFIF